MSTSQTVLGREVKRAVIAASTLGDNTLVAAVSGSRICVVSCVLVASGGLNTVRFESGASGTALTGQMDIVDNGQLVLDFNPTGWFETAKGTLLNLELSAATAVAGVLSYIEL